MDSAAASPDDDAREDRRIAALHALGILDTPAEALLDGLVRAAAAACGMPLAALNLLDRQRQWTKARAGFDGPADLPRAESICTFVVESGIFLEIPDTHRDARVAGRRCVREAPAVRFYAGAPLVAPGGEVVGALAVLDRRPHAGLAPAQRTALEELAGAAMQALLLRSAAHRGVQASSEQMYRQLSESAPVGIFHSDARGRVIYANPRTGHIFGRPGEVLLGDEWVRSVHPDDIAQVVARWRAANASGGVFDHVYRLRRPDGTPVHVCVRAHSVRLPDGSAGGFVGTVEDVTAQVQDRERLHASNEFLARAEQIAGVGAWRYDLVTREMAWTGQTRRICDLPEDYQPRGDEHLRFLDAEAQETVRRTAQGCIAAGGTWDVTVPMTTARGRRVWVRSIGQIEMRDDRARALVGALQDVTEARLARAALEQSQERLYRALEGSGLALWDLDLADETLYLSEHWGVMLGGAPRETRCAARDLLGLVPPEDLPSIQAGLRPVVSGRSAVYVVEHRVRREDGSLLWIHSEGRVAERDAKGAPRRMVGTNRDITAAKQAERDLREARDAADAANRAKSQFLATMSHEIRTPLNGIIGITRLLMDEPLTPAVRRHADLVDRSAHSLLSLVNDILDVSKIEAGQMEIEFLPFDLHELVEDLVNLYRLRASEKSLLFRVRIAPDVPRHVEADPMRLRQVLVNLLGNALKFTHSGWIGLDVRSRNDESVSIIEFVVTDTGVGIPADVLPQLFTRFMQADSSTSRRFGGTGLGLAIVRQLTDLMGGSVRAASVAGKGSRFTVTLPVLPTQEPPAATSWQDLAPATQSARVLVVEDNPTNQVVAFGMLRKLGYEDVSIASDGAEAVVMAQRQDFDLVLMDCQMPEMDGYEATRRLRAAGFTAPIVAMTANAIKGDRERCIAAGMNDYLTKPMDLRVLRGMLARWGGGQPSRLADLPLFDADALQSRFGGDRELEQVALSTFQQATPGLLRKLEAALDADDREQFQRLAHSAKGSSGMVSADRCAALGALMEERAPVAPQEDLRRLLEDFRRAFDEFAALLRAR